MTNRTSNSTMRAVVISPEAGVPTPVMRATKKKKKNVIKSGGQRFAQTTPLARVRMNLQGDSTSLLIERTELFTQVNASPTANAFTAFSFPWYPGAITLNWLRNFSNSYSQYEVHRMEFTYVPNVPTTSTGVVAMAFFTDYRDTTPTDMNAMLSTEQSLYSPVWGGSDGGTYLQRFGAPPGNVVSFEVPKHALQYDSGTHKMFKMTTNTGFGTIISNPASVNLYTPGSLVVATSGVAASSNCGAIFCRYRVMLKGPIPITSQS